MTRRITLATAILVFIISMNGVGLISGYANDIMPAQDRSTTVIWEIKQTPETAFESFWTGGGYWLADESSHMTFSVGDIEEDVTGGLTLGNMTVIANDTMIARDLALGVWGIVEFSPGLFIKIGSNDIAQLNATAFEAVERVKWNYLNGTMVSYYDNYTIGTTEYECIFFEYQQDSGIIVTAQHTKLVYNLSNGILLYGNTSYFFGSPSHPYNFEIEFFRIQHSGTMPNPLPVYVIAFTAVILVIIIIKLRQRK